MLAILGARWRIADESLKALTYSLSSQGVPGRPDAAAVCRWAISRRVREPQQLPPPDTTPTKASARLNIQRLPPPTYPWRLRAIARDQLQIDWRLRTKGSALHSYG